MMLEAHLSEAVDILMQEYHAVPNSSPDLPPVHISQSQHTDDPLANKRSPVRHSAEERMYRKNAMPKGPRKQKPEPMVGCVVGVGQGKTTASTGKKPGIAKQTSHGENKAQGEHNKGHDDKEIKPKFDFNWRIWWKPSSGGYPMWPQT